MLKKGRLRFTVALLCEAWGRAPNLKKHQTVIFQQIKVRRLPLIAAKDLDVSSSLQETSDCNFPADKSEVTASHCYHSLKDLDVSSSPRETSDCNFLTDKKSIGDLAKNDKIEHRKIGELFYYSSKEKEKLKQKLEEDLIAFNYVTENKKNKFKRYVLPIYVDVESLETKGIENIDNYLENWKSIAYLRMLTKIHDYFLEYYKLGYSKGLNVDILTVALLEIFDSEIKPYPKGLKKSVEIGRATAGKCYFIDEVMSPIPLSVDIALILQGKDVFSVVVEVSKNK